MGSEVDIEVTELAVGNRVTQAAVTCRDGEIIVFRAAAALGGHDLNVDRQWSAMPEVPSPDQCDSRGATSSGDRLTTCRYHIAGRTGKEMFTTGSTQWRYSSARTNCVGGSVA